VAPLFEGAFPQEILMCATCPQGNLEKPPPNVFPAEETRAGATKCGSGPKMEGPNSPDPGTKNE